MTKALSPGHIKVAELGSGIAGAVGGGAESLSFV